MENSRQGSRIRQRCIANLGRFDKLIASSAFDSLADSVARIARVIPILQAEKLGQLRGDQQVSVGPDLVFRRLWSNLGFRKVFRQIKISTHPELSFEKIIYNLVLEFLLAQGTHVGSEDWRQRFGLIDSSAFNKSDIQTVLRWLGDSDSPSGISVDQEQRRKDRIAVHVADQGNRAISSLVVLVSGGCRYSESLAHNSQRLGGVKKYHSLVGVIFDQNATILGVDQLPINGHIPARWSTRSQELCRRFRCNQVHLVIDASLLPKNSELTQFIRPLGCFSSITVLEASRQEKLSETADLLKHLKPDCRLDFDAGSRRFEWQILVDKMVGPTESTVSKSVNDSSRWVVDGNSYERSFSKNVIQTGSILKTEVEQTGESGSLNLTRVVDTAGTVDLETMALIYTAWHIGRDGVSWILESIPPISLDDSDDSILNGHLMLGFLALRIRIAIEEKISGCKNSRVSWPDALQAITQTKVYSVVKGNQNVLVRNEMSPLSVDIFRSIGVALPPKVKHLDVTQLSNNY